MPKGKNIFEFIFTRSMVFYLAVILLSIPLINYQRIKIADQSKLAFYQHPTAYQALVEYLQEGKAIPQEKLLEYLYFFEKSAQQHSANADSLYVLGFLYQLSGNSSKAIEAYQKGREQGQNNLWFYYNLGTAYFQNERYEEALNILSKAITIPPEEALNFFKNSNKVLVPVMIQANITPVQLKRNIKELYRDIYAMIVLVNFQMKNFEQMRKFADLARVAGVGHAADFYFYAGLASYQLGDDSQAVLNFKKAIEKRTDLSEAYEYLALSLQRQGLNAEAKQASIKAKMLSEINPLQPLTEKKFAFRIY